MTSLPGLQLIGKQVDVCDYVTGACRMRTAVLNGVDLRRSTANQEYYFNSLFCNEAKLIAETHGRTLNLRMRKPVPTVEFRGKGAEWQPCSPSSVTRVSIPL